MDYYSSLFASKVSGGGGGGGASVVDGLIDRSLSGALTTNATAIGDSALRGCNKITSLSAPQATKIYDSGCKECTALTSISFDSLTSYSGAGHFQSCTSLTNVYMPLIGQLPNFYGCKSLAFFDAPSCTVIISRTFYDCNALAKIVLRKNSVVSLYNVDAFTNTPLRGYNGLTGVVYVPSSLISSYQSASNWSSLYSAGYCTFSAIEGSAYE